MKVHTPLIGDCHATLTMFNLPCMSMVRALRAQISVLEKSILKQISPVAEFNLLKTTPGIGDILDETI